MAPPRLTNASSPSSSAAPVAAADRDAFIVFGLAAIIVAALADSIPLGLVVVIVGTALFAAGRRLFGGSEGASPRRHPD